MTSRWAGAMAARLRPRARRSANAWLASCLVLTSWSWLTQSCASTGGTVGRWTIGREVEHLDAARMKGSAVAAAWYARLLEIEGRYAEALAAWVEAPPSAWRTARVRRLTSFVTPSPALLARLIGSDRSVAISAAEAAAAGGDAPTRLSTEARAGSVDALGVAFETPATGETVTARIRPLGGEVPRFAGDISAHALVVDEIPPGPPRSRLVLHGRGPYVVETPEGTAFTTPRGGYPNARWVEVALPSGAAPADVAPVRILRPASPDGPSQLRIYMTVDDGAPSRPPESAVEGVEVALAAGDLSLAAHHAEALSGRDDPVAVAARLELALAEIAVDGPGREHEALERALTPMALGAPAGVRALIAALRAALDRHEEAARLVATLPLEDPATLTTRLELADRAGDVRALADLVSVVGASGASPLPCGLRRSLAERVSPHPSVAALYAPRVGSVGVGGACALAEGQLLSARTSRNGPSAVREGLAEILSALPPGSAGPRATLCLLMAKAALSAGEEGAARDFLACAASEGDPTGGAAALLSALDARLLSAERVRAGGPPPGDPDGLLDGLDPETRVRDAIPILRAALSAPLSSHVEIAWHERLDAITPLGAVQSRHHTVMCFWDADATSRFGEIEVPPLASVVMARTWKVHRTPGREPVLQPVMPEDTPVGLEVVSLAALEPGDCAELLWVERRQGAGVDAFETPPFFFDDPRGPTRTARWLLDARLAATARMIRSGSGPAPMETRTEDGHVVWSRQDVPPFVPEPGDTRSDLRRASIRARGAAFDPDARVETARRSVQMALDRRSPELRRLVADARDADDAISVDALRHAVRAAIPEDDADPAEADLVRALRTGRGSRALALAAALHTIGHPFALLLARPLHEAGPGSTLDELDAFSWPLVEAERPQGPALVDPKAADGEAAPLVRGADAIVLAASPDTDGFRRRTLDPPTGQRHIAWTLTTAPLALEAHLEATERLTGVHASAWRELLAKIPAANHGLLMSHLTAASFPDARDARHTLEGLGPDDEALVWKATATTGLRPLSPERVELSFALAPDEPIGAAGELPTRRTPLFFNMSADAAVTVCVQVPTGWRVATPPEPVEIDRGGFLFSRTATTGRDGCALVVEKRWRTRPRWVTPDEFPAFLEAAFAVQRADRVRILLTSSPEPRGD